MKTKRQLGGIKAAAKIRRTQGTDFYASIGKLGGRAKKTKPHGFMVGADGLSAKERAKQAGVKGGKISKRGKDTKPRKQYKARKKIVK